MWDFGQLLAPQIKQVKMSLKIEHPYTQINSARLKKLKRALIASMS